MKCRSSLFYVADARTYLSPCRHLRLIAHVTCTVRGVTAGDIMFPHVSRPPSEAQAGEDKSQVSGRGENTSACSLHRDDRRDSDGCSLCWASVCRMSQWGKCFPHAVRHVPFLSLLVQIFSSCTRSRRRCMLMFFMIQSFSPCRVSCYHRYLQ